jgi:hypothetical protein
MRPLLYLVALLLALPQIVLATAFGFLAHLVGGHTLGSLIERVFTLFFALLSWKGLLVLVLAFIALIALGFSSRFRWIGSTLLGLLVITSATLLVWILRETISIGDFWIFVPGIGALALAGRLVVLDLPQLKNQLGAHKNLSSVSF